MNSTRKPRLQMLRHAFEPAERMLSVVWQREYDFEPLGINFEYYVQRLRIFGEFFQKLEVASLDEVETELVPLRAAFIVMAWYTG